MEGHAVVLITVNPCSAKSTFLSIKYFGREDKPSMISISPLYGQLGPNIHIAGHDPHCPPGTCAKSTTTRLPVPQACLLVILTLSLPTSTFGFSTFI